MAETTASITKSKRGKLRRLAPLDELASYRLAHDKYNAIYRLWAKALLRIEEDPEGSITLASTLIEDISKFTLDSLGQSYDQKADAPALFNKALKALDLAPQTQVEEALRSISQSCINIAKNVATLRNKLGDAHGRGFGHAPVNTSHAEFALNLAGATTCFLVSNLEATLAAKRLITTDGRVALKFSVTTVWRLLDHARNAERSLPCYDEKDPKPALWLVGDSGIYLMSNGFPPMDRSGKIFRDTGGQDIWRLAAHAEGCNPAYDKVDNWWPIHERIEGGDDFNFPIPIGEFENVLPLCKQQIIVMCDRENYWIVADTSFDTANIIELR